MADSVVMGAAFAATASIAGDALGAFAPFATATNLWITDALTVLARLAQGASLIAAAAVVETVCRIDATPVTELLSC